MKRIVFILLAALGATHLSAQFIDIDVDLYADHYYYDDDIYRYGFGINNYAADYSEHFVRQVSYEYGIRKSLIRNYLRRGYSPGDILFGAELASRSRYSFQYVMECYRRMPAHNWLTLSIDLGIPRGSASFGLILGSFRRHYTDWGHYYRRYHPHTPPPMYNHGWSYFRPSPDPRPRPDSRPPRVNRPGRTPERRSASSATPPSRQEQAAPSPNNGNRNPSSAQSGGNRRGSDSSPAVRNSDRSGSSSASRGGDRNESSGSSVQRSGSGPNRNSSGRSSSSRGGSSSGSSRSSGGSSGSGRR